MSTLSVDVGRPALPGAVTAFLRGVERRALVLAELQAGGAARGDAAVTATAREFSGWAVQRPLAQWPLAFWSSLLGNPLLHGAPAPVDGAGWTGLAAGPRAALLLRLAAGLDEADAASVLGVGLPAYRLALQRAVEQLGGPEALEAFHAQLQARIEAVATERVQLLAGPDAQTSAEMPPASTEAAGPRAPRAVLLSLWALLAACIAAFIATFWWAPAPAGRTQGPARIEPLPAPAAPAARYRPDAALLVHRDFALLVDASAAPMLTELEFYSWLAAGAGAGTAAAIDASLASASGLPPAIDTAAGTAGELETVDAPL
ncbi:hypothetical protein ACFFGH_01825 [Lysobacter korlensis]|uniref:Uncharacterized protein n=1 Tax=Lysobacter korlensis TaxID=553636 RepID=A0ABV6RHY0_9GAMM